MCVIQTGNEHLGPEEDAGKTMIRPEVYRKFGREQNAWRSALFSHRRLLEWTNEYLTDTRPQLEKTDNGHTTIFHFDKKNVKLIITTDYRSKMTIISCNDIA